MISYLNTGTWNSISEKLILCALRRSDVGYNVFLFFSKNIQHKTWKFILTKEYERGKNKYKEAVAPKHLMRTEVAVL